MKKFFKMITILTLSVGMCFCIVGASTFIVNGGQSAQTVYAATVLKKGSRGDTVKKLQQKLKNWGYYKGSVDGIYGSKTVEAVKYFQRKNKLAVDGIAGAKTLAAAGITASSSSGSSSGGQYSNADIELLARLIYGEARGESYVGQVAVGAVVMNRIRSSSFPNTMSGVIYQRFAFTAVDDGQIRSLFILH